MSTQRRRRIWSTTSSSLLLTTSGVPGQLSLNLSDTVQGKMGLLSMAGFTVSRTHVCTLIASGAGEVGLDVHKIIWGIGVFASGIDNGDYPDLDNYSGDWMCYECNIFFLPAQQNQHVLPGEAAFNRADYRSMRKIGRNDESLFLVAQIEGTAPATGILMHFIVSSLYLMP